ncbi:MAG: ribonuclease R [bacterium]|jgi:ribonuclease R
MKITGSNISQLLEEAFPNGLTVKELLGLLGQKKTKKTQLRKSLRELAKSVLVEKNDNRYFLIKKVFDQKEEGVQKKKEPREKGKLRGTFVLKGDTCGLRTSKNPELLPISKADALSLMHGDEVSFQIIKAKKDKKSLFQKKRIPKIHVISILKRRYNRLNGVFSIQEGKPVFTPSNQKIQQIFQIINPDFMDVSPESKVQIQITRYPAMNVTAEGRIIDSVSSEINEDQEILSILKLHKIRHEFPQSVIQASKEFPSTVRLLKSDNRTDLRNLPFVTIDGDSAKDFDDAVYAEKDEKGYRVWVSIADVAEYVTEKSVIDEEAKQRATSVYIPGTVYPMLPEVLSNGLCSLNPNVNRKTLTCEMLLSEEGDLVEYKVYESMIKTAGRLTYGEVDTFFETGEIDARKDFPKMKEFLSLYQKIAQVLALKRRRRGSLDFSFPDSEFIYNEKNELTGIEKSYQTPAMKLIEQFMLEANETVGKFCLEKQIQILWRDHLSPTEEKLANLKNVLWNAGVKISTLKTQKDLNGLLEIIKDHDAKEWLEHNLLRSMSQAYYDTNNEGHFGLAAKHYCHFTSPIRRYPDLIVHRALKRWVQTETKEDVPASLGEWTSGKERLAAKAERDTKKLKKMLFMEDRIGETFTVRVSGVNANGIYVEVDSPYVEGFIPLSELGDDYYRFQEEGNSFVGSKSKKVIRVGVRLEVCLTRIDPRYRMAEFELVQWL